VAVVCLRQLLGVVATIQARRRGRATLFGNTRRGAPRSLFRVAVACRCATKSKLNPNWEEMPNSPFEPLLLQGAWITPHGIKFEMSKLQKVQISIWKTTTFHFHPLEIALRVSLAMSGWRQRTAFYTPCKTPPNRDSTTPPFAHREARKSFSPYSRSVSPSNPHSHSFSGPTRSAACCLVSPRCS